MEFILPPNGSLSAAVSTLEDEVRKVERNDYQQRAETERNQLLGRRTVVFCTLWGCLSKGRGAPNTSSTAEHFNIFSSAHGCPEIPGELSGLWQSRRERSADGGALSCQPHTAQAELGSQHSRRMSLGLLAKQKGQRETRISTPSVISKCSCRSSVLICSAGNRRKNGQHPRYLG